MIDSATHKPVRVLLDVATGPYIYVSVDHFDQVRKVLQDNNIPHWVDHIGISVDGRPMERLINIKKGSDPDRVQALLDAAA